MTGLPVAVIWEIMLGAALAALFLRLFVIGFVRPRRSREAEQGVARMFAVGEPGCGVGTVAGEAAHEIETRHARERARRPEGT
jgi:hypothetical protein